MNDDVPNLIRCDIRRWTLWPFTSECFPDHQRISKSGIRDTVRCYLHSMGERMKVEYTMGLPRK